MKAGVSLMLGFLLAFVLIFGYWLRTPHQLGARWNAMDRDLEQLDLAGNSSAR